jgi:alkylation response protein AidB-like acyl-CoA dehydrogenase
MEEHGKIRRSLIDKLFDLGVMGTIPEAFGGAGATFFHSVLAVEMLTTVDASVGVLVDVQNTLVMNAILRWGSDDLKRRSLPQLSGTKVGAYAVSETGSEGTLKAQAVARGDGFSITGRKLWITNGDEADIFVVLANAEPSAGYRGVTVFVVERGFRGFEVGKKEDKLGIRASSTCELMFDDCYVETRNVLGSVGVGYKVAIETINEGRIGIGAQMLGIAGAALSHAIKYVKQRQQFGKSIAEFQESSSRSPRLGPNSRPPDYWCTTWPDSTTRASHS